MFTDSNNLKDTNIPLPSLPLHKGEEQTRGMSYTKTNKLVTALFIVTDMIDKNEPLRNKLRTLGMEVVSDINFNLQNTSKKVSDIISFLDIAVAINLISPMNHGILKKEFSLLNDSIKDATDTRTSWLEEFLLPSLEPNSPHPDPLLIKERGDSISKGHGRIGVQKGSTLMKALSDRANNMSNINAPTKINFDMLKKERRFNIIKIIKGNNGSATIKDIREKINIGQSGESIVSEKTLQRELLSMVQDGVLEKTGKKSWSRYFLK